MRTEPSSEEVLAREDEDADGAARGAATIMGALEGWAPPPPPLPAIVEVPVLLPAALDAEALWTPVDDDTAW